MQRAGGAAGAAAPGALRRGYVDVPWGQLHYARCGVAGRPPVVLVHQTPRSWDEFRDVLALLGASFDVVAPDTAGFGASDLADGDADSIERYADGLELLVDRLQLGRLALVGHHTGALVALELAARRPEHVWALVLSSAPLKTPGERSAALAAPGIDEVTARPDGGHLTELWRRRLSFYPPGRPDLLHRFVTDALRVGARLEEGHRAVNRYDVQSRIGRVVAPTLVVAATDDPFAYPMVGRWREALPGSTVVEVVGGTVPLPDQVPDVFAARVGEFLTSVAAGRPARSTGS